MIQIVEDKEVFTYYCSGLMSFSSEDKERTEEEQIVIETLAKQKKIR